MYKRAEFSAILCVVVKGRAEGENFLLHASKFWERTFVYTGKLYNAVFFWGSNCCEASVQ